MKGKILLMMVLTSTWSAFAGGPEPVLSSVAIPAVSGMQGLYGGLGVGGAFGQFDTSVDTAAPRPALPFLAGVSSSGKRSSDAVFGNAFLGYGFVFNTIYIGPEGYVNFGSRPRTSLAIQSTGTLPVESITIQTNDKLKPWEAGIDGRLGWLATLNTLLFVRVGAAFNEITINSNTTVTSQGTFPPTTQTLNYTATKTKVGLRVGGGIEQKITNSITVRADYIYTNYGRFSASNTNPTPPLGPINNTVSVRAQTQTIIGSLIYHFAV